MLKEDVTISRQNLLDDAARGAAPDEVSRQDLAAACDHYIGTDNMRPPVLL
jgi:hypothetical protein